MKILLDHCVPRRFRRLLTGHEVRTAFEMGWAGLSNGALLAQASREFGAFLTVDQNVQFQRNLATLPLPVGIIVAPDHRFETLAPYAPAVLDCLSQAPQPPLQISADKRRLAACEFDACLNSFCGSACQSAGGNVPR